MKQVERVIMIDDDPYSHLICSKIIKRFKGDIEFVEFILPEKGIEYIESHYSNPANNCPTILLLDINMPIMSGWDFLERYDRAPSHVKDQVTIYMLSSSVDLRDKQRASGNIYIKDFLMKPFKKEMVEIIFDNSGNGTMSLDASYI